MGIHQSQSELFNDSVNLDQGVRADHPLPTAVGDHKPGLAGNFRGLP